MKAGMLTADVPTSHLCVPCDSPISYGAASSQEIGDCVTEMNRQVAVFGTPFTYRPSRAHPGKSPPQSAKIKQTAPAIGVKFVSI